MPSPRERVLVAMSGGVDSSVAAARLVASGLDVVGVTLHLWDYPKEDADRARCCAPEDQHDARRVADRLGIPHYTFDRRELFAREVVEPFVDAYAAGDTPSPCVACNRSVKMRELFALADRLGADRVATGHYARVVREGARAWLARGRDAAKDQSYFLHVLAERELARLLLPLGDSTKAEVRGEAERLALPGAGKAESQELCFVTPGEHGRFVEARAGERLRPGPIVDDAGREVGAHAGVHRFTVGQRKGLGVALGQKAFVVGVDAASAKVTLGPEDALLHAGARLSQPRFRDDVALPVRALVQVRYRQSPVPATIAREDGQVAIRFDEKVRAVVRGQVAVAYDGERVLGGGTIAEVLAWTRSALAAILALALLPACSLGKGEGDVKSDRLFAQDCWQGPFDLAPDFFSAEPYKRTVTLRIQHGGDIAEVSDGMSVLVDDIDYVRAHLDQPIGVGLPVGVTVAGVPIVANPDPPHVHLTLYLNQACHIQNVALYAVAGHVTFHSLFSGDLNETDAAQKLSYAEFGDIQVADPRDQPPGGGQIPASHLSVLYGYFRFYFERGQPGQPFP